MHLQNYLDLYIVREALNFVGLNLECTLLVRVKCKELSAERSYSFINHLSESKALPCYI